MAVLKPLINLLASQLSLSQPQCEHTSSEQPSWLDCILQPAFTVIVAVLSFTWIRLACASIMLPLYLSIAVVRSIMPHLLDRGLSLLSKAGRTMLLERGHEHADHRRRQAESQLQGRYQFDRGACVVQKQSSADIVSTLRHTWDVQREYFTVCGLEVCVVHARPEKATRSVLLLHGNPSWSYMYRHIFKGLVDAKLEVFALDWAGMGGSDKPVKLEEITFELHMHTLVKLFDVYNLQDVHILAHDWGGCVALCTIPYLPAQSCSGLMLLNSFFPPSPSDISWNGYSLYLLWLSAQGILSGQIPEGSIIRFMAPSVTSPIAAGYASPYKSAKDKTSITRFARLVPGMPSIVYSLFASVLGRLLDGVCDVDTFSSLDEQRRLRDRGVGVREYWKSGKASMRVSVVFGARDTLLGDFFNVLCQGIVTKFGAVEQHLLPTAGHYSTEEDWLRIMHIFLQFLTEDQ